MTAIDAHCHFGPGLRRARPFGPLKELATADDLLAELSKAGIERAIAFAPRWHGGDFVDPDYRQANAAIAAGFQEHPNRLVGFVRVNPKFGRGAAEQLESGVSEGFQGLKLDAETESFSPLDLDLLGPLFEICQANGLPVLVHTGFHPAQPLLWLEAAEAFPQVNLILGHMGYRIVSDAIIAAERADNIFLETSSANDSYVNRAIQAMGAPRVIFGTDTPFSDPQVDLARIRSLDLPAADLDQVCHKNILDLLPHGWGA
jgi:predicted TIM-barrel fold metal-dependent hydrolase